MASTKKRINSNNLFFILGPCVIESEKQVLHIAGQLAEIALRQNIQVIFKASYDKANRTSGTSFRGLGIDAGLKILQKVREQFSLAVITDVHNPSEVPLASSAVDFLQTPAMLCRQSDLIAAAAASGLPVNYKKGQFLSPHEMNNIVNKALAAGAARENIFLCERGFSFGYNNLVVDMRSLAIMRTFGYPVVFDATHSVQLPGGSGTQSTGEREFIPVLARAAMAAGVDGIFMETHPEPEKALSDGANSYPLDKLEALLCQLVRIHQALGQ